MTACASKNFATRRALSFSLRGLLLVFVVVAVPLAVVVQRAQRQKAAVRFLREAGAIVFYDYQVADRANPTEDTAPPGPDWLRDALGIDYVARVHQVDCTHVDLTVNWAQLFKRLGDLPELRHLNLTNCDARPEEFLALQPLTSLERLHLSFSRVNDESLQILAGMKNLKHLDLSFTETTARGLSHLAAANSLVSLNLEGCPWTDDPTLLPAELPALEFLCLSGTNTTGRVFATLRGSNRLETLLLDGCPLHAESYQHLGRLTSLNELSLNATPTDDGMLWQLAQLDLISLDLSETEVADDGLGALTNMRWLFSLNLRGTLVRGPGLVHLTNLRELMDLDLSCTQIDDDGLAGLERLASVDDLDISNNDLTLRGLRHLVRMPALRSLTVLTDNGSYDAHEIGDRFRCMFAEELAADRLPAKRREALAERVDRIADALAYDGVLSNIAPDALNDERLMPHLPTLSADEVWAVAELALARRDYPEASMDDDSEFFWRKAVNSRLSPRFDPEFGFYDGVDSQQFELHRAACRKFLGLPSTVPVASGERRNIATTKELRGVLQPLLKGAPYDPLLSELVGRHNDVAAMAAIEVAVRPDSVSWRGLLEAAPGLKPRLSAAWLASDPTNAVAWLGSGRFISPEGSFSRRSGIDFPYFYRPLLALVERANECPRLAFRPSPPWLSAELLSKARAILEQDGISIPPRPLHEDWSNPWQWYADWETVRWHLSSLDLSESPLIRSDHPAEAERFLAAGETLVGKLITARPRELATVLRGCLMFKSWLRRYRASEQPPAAAALQRSVRWTACYRLAKRLTELSFDPIGGPIVDETTMSAWMAGLDECHDERAVEMMRAIDDWAKFDSSAITATFDELLAIYQEQWNEAVPLDADGRPVLEKMQSEASLDELDPGYYYLDSLPIGRRLRTRPVDMRG